MAAPACQQKSAHNLDDKIMQPEAHHPRRPIGAAFARLGLALSAVVLAIGDWRMRQDLRVPPSEWLPQPDIPGLLYPVLALVAGFGLALPLACLWVNRRQVRRMLRATPGRALAAVLMAGLTPVGFWGKVPAVFGFFWALGWGNITAPGADVGLVLAVTVGPLLIAWPLAHALIYGLPRHLRIPGFLAFNISQMALVILLENVWPGRL